MRTHTAAHGIAVRMIGCGLVAGTLGLVAVKAKAQVAVSDSGMPTYAHAIKVPPGIAGLAPKLSLVYTGGGNGPVGWGWALSGVSSITRCAATRAVDGTPAAVRYDVNDKLCLDGQRLIQTDANGAVLAFPQTGDAATVAAGSYREFRLERDAKVRIRAYESGYGNMAPKYFRMWTADGMVVEFGESPGADAAANARINASSGGGLVAWPVSRISDRSGNYAQYLYVVPREYPGDEWNLAEIRYTGNSTTGQAPGNKIVFTYVDRDDNGGDRSLAYHGRAKRLTIQSLTSITSYVGSTASGTTKLGYTVGSTTKRGTLSSVAECAGDGSAACQPASTFRYTPGGLNYLANATFKQTPSGVVSGLGGVELLPVAYPATTPTGGVITGDFNGDGRTDIIRWADNPANNRLFLSAGQGNFVAVPSGSGAGQFNIADQNLFRSPYSLNNGVSPYRTDMCFYTVAADFNADGMTDLMRFASPGRDAKYNNVCPTGNSSYLYISNGDGSFTRSVIRDAGNQAAIVLGRTLGEKGGSDRYGYANFLVADFNTDGRLDLLVTSASTAIDRTEGNNPTVWCYSWGTCGTALWLGNGDGSFTRTTPAYFAPGGGSSESPPMYSDGRWMPFSDPNGRSWRAHDSNADGMADLVFETTKAHLGDGAGGFRVNNEPTQVVGCSSGSSTYGDFNGDGRSDAVCHAEGKLYFGGSQGAFTYSEKPWAFPYAPGASVPLAVDVDDDGRTDVLVVGANAEYGPNSLYRSEGNGWFAPITSAQSSLLSESFGPAESIFIGDFTGSGTMEFFVAGPASQSCPTETSCPQRNRLLVKTAATPPEVLSSTTSPTGVVTTLTYTTLNKGDRYATDRGTVNAATYPSKESAVRSRTDRNVPSTVAGGFINQTPSTIVVSTMTVDSGVGTVKNTTEYAYRGYKVDQYGRGSLGFREIRQETTAPDGASKLTAVQQKLQVFPYVGTGVVTETYLGPLSPIGSAQAGQLLSRTESIYCDQTSAAGAENTATVSAPCPSTSKIKKPYVRKSVQTGADLNGTALPTTTTTTTYSGGYPTLIQVDTAGTGPAGAQTFVKKQALEYWPDNIAADNWLLGLVKKSTVTNTVPDSLNSITTSAGSAPKATATSGQ